MLRIFHRLQELDFGMLMELYSEGNRENAAERFPDDEMNIAIMKAEQDFYQYLNEYFFLTPGAFYAVWEESGRYLSALRLEPYQDGLLLEALETHPDHRGNGYAKQLVLAVLELLRQEKSIAVYSHVNKRNTPSIRTHMACGFHRISEQATYIDGSVTQRSCTMQYLF